VINLEIKNLHELKQILNEVPNEVLENWGIANNELSDMEVDLLRKFPTDLNPLKDEETEGIKLAEEEMEKYPQLIKVRNWLKAIKDASWHEFEQHDIEVTGEFIHYKKNAKERTRDI